MPVKDEFLKNKIKTIPKNPGIYQFFDINNNIIYIGKAKNLKKRVSSYFTSNRGNKKTELLTKNIRNIKYLVVDTEADALLLENSLIKKYQPKYNIQLKDDKTYPWICIKNEPFPRVFKTRKIIKDGSKYFGPYPNIKTADTLLSLFHELYPLRSCNLDLSKKKHNKVCLEYHIGNCMGGCENFETEEKYNSYVSDIENIIKGNIKSVIEILTKRMSDFANALKFEEAQVIKDNILSLKKYQSKSTIVSPKIDNVDVITIHNEKNYAYVNYLVIKNGSIIHGHTFEVKKKLDENSSKIIEFVLPQLRSRFNSQANEILISEDLSVDFEGLKFINPKRGDKKALIDLSTRNIKFYVLDKKRQLKNITKEKPSNVLLRELKNILNLSRVPFHIECFDNSNLSGSNPVAACVVFKNGKPSKKDYRHFNIKTVVGPDDFLSMEEVVFRRYKRMIESGQTLPQLIIIDGGKGQLKSSLSALQRLNIDKELNIISIAKRLEEIFSPGNPLPLYLDKRSRCLKLIQHIRNEAHRFGISHHRNKRSKNFLKSEIDQIKGIGNKTKEFLFIEFKTIDKIKAANLNTLTTLIGKSKGNIIYNYFREERE